jgi:hypothetical protein
MGIVPTGSVNACIPGPATVTVEGGIDSADSLTVGGGTGTATVQVVSNNTTESILTFSGASQIESNGVIDLVSNEIDSEGYASSLSNDATGATIINDGTLEDSGNYIGQIQCELTNDADGTVSLAAATTATGSFTFVNNGSFTVPVGDDFQANDLALTQSGGTYDNAGTSEFTGGGSAFTQSGGTETGNAIFLDGDVTFTDSSGTGSFLLESENTLVGTIPVGQTVTVMSTSSVETLTNLSSTTVTNDGTLVITSTGSDSYPSGLEAGTLDNVGTIDLSGSASGVDEFADIALVNQLGGVVDVTSPGTAFNNGTTTNDGTIEVGSAAGLVFNSDPYAVTVQSGTTAEITGAGSVALGGVTLQVTTVGKLPKAGTIFTLINTSGGVSGTFNTLEFPKAAYDVSYTPTTVTLTAEKPFKAKGKAVKATAGTSATVTVATLSKLPASGTITASINWGDATAASAGTVTTSGTTGTVSGTHTYASAGHYTVTTTITDSDGTDFTVTGKATVKS